MSFLFFKRSYRTIRHDCISSFSVILALAGEVDGKQIVSLFIIE